MGTKVKQSFTNYSIGDFLIKVKNASMAGNKKLSVTSNNQIYAVAVALEKLGYVESVKKNGNLLDLALVYKNKQPVIMNVKLVSKPGLRVYMGVDEIEKKKGPSTFIISTPQGILGSRAAIKARTGGEVVAEVW